MARLSYMSGAGDKPLIGETIGRYFDAVCAANPDRLALIVPHQRLRWTYSDLKLRVDAFAAGLVALGLARRDRLGIWLPNCCEWMVAQYAAAKLGIILVAINPAYRNAEVECALNKVRCKALITAPGHKTSDYLAILNHLAPELADAQPGLLSAKRLPYLKTVIILGPNAHPGCLRYDDVLTVGVELNYRILDEIGQRLQFDDPINIQFTSGTTGSPKGVTLTHHNILNNGLFAGDAIGLQPDERVCAPVPLHHCFGMVPANLGCLTHAACAVYPAEAFDPLAVLKTIENERCAVLYGVPAMFVDILRHFEFAGFDLTSLRTGIIAGAPCPIKVAREVVERMHMREITIAYGTTETSSVSFQSSTKDLLDRRASTVGRVLPHLQAKIVDGDGRVVPQGEPGELCIRGYAVMPGYWDDPIKTAEVLDEAGWMQTGDLATFDESGYCNIVGRIKDRVIRGGKSIDPREVEELLYHHPAVQDVQVIGVPDSRYGEELCAWIIVKPGESLETDAIRNFCRGRIAHHKIPRYIKFVDTFPTTATGRVRKFAMREAMSVELGFASVATA